MKTEDFYSRRGFFRSGHVHSLTHRQTLHHQVVNNYCLTCRQETAFCAHKTGTSSGPNRRLSGNTLKHRRKHDGTAFQIDFLLLIFVYAAAGEGKKISHFDDNWVHSAGKFVLRLINSGFAVQQCRSVSPPVTVTIGD